MKNIEDNKQNNYSPILDDSHKTVEEQLKVIEDFLIRNNIDVST